MTREEIIEQLDGIVGTYEILIGNGVNSDILDVDDIEAIREAISALSENKGEWTRHTRVEPVYSIDGVKTWGDKCQCNKCTFTTIAVEGFGYYNFCPNCGAKMIEY